MLNEKIIALIFLILFVLGFAIMIIASKRNNVITFLLGGIILIVAYMIPCIISNKEKHNLYNRKELVMQSPEEYSFYLDGEDVDYKNIDLNQYDISYDLEDKKVFLTKK